jgi:hypothetical protein
MTEKTALQRLDLRHRLEEVCEPYRLFPSVDDDGELRLELAQFGCSNALNHTLAGALASALVEADFAAAIEGETLVLGASGRRA